MSRSYRRNGFTVVSRADKDRLLQTYWSIPARQIETSVVLAKGRWMDVPPLMREAALSLSPMP